MRNKEKYFLFLQPYDLKQFVKSAKDEKPNLQPPNQPKPNMMLNYL